MINSITLKCSCKNANLQCKIYSGDKPFTHLSMHVQLYIIEKTTIVVICYL